MLPHNFIQLNNIYKSFGALNVLNGVNLSVQCGETVVVIGQSGVGKSVMLRLILRLLDPDEGEVLWNGKNIAHMGEKELEEMRSHFAMLFQSGALFDSLTVEENVTFNHQIKGERNAKKLSEIAETHLRSVGLSENIFPDMKEKLPSMLSGGQRKRVALARALAMEPDIILYDEPTTGLDPIMSDAIADLIISTRERLKHRQFTSIVVTHDMHVALKVASRIIMLHDGNIIYDAPPKEYCRIRDSEEKILSENELCIRQFVLGLADGPIRCVR